MFAVDRRDSSLPFRILPHFALSSAATCFSSIARCEAEVESSGSIQFSRAIIFAEDANNLLAQCETEVRLSRLLQNTSMAKGGSDSTPYYVGCGTSRVGLSCLFVFFPVSSCVQ